MVNETTDKIEFAFPLDSIFENVSLQSIYSAKNMQPTASGEDATDAYGLMTDERDFVNSHIAKAITDLFALFVKQTKTISNSLFVKKTMNNIECCGFSLVRETEDGKSLYNPNRLSVIDYNCESFIHNYILLEWAKANRLESNIGVYTAGMNQNIRNIRNNNFELKKSQYNKTYSPFIKP